MRTLMPDIEARVATGMQRKSQYDTLARRQKALNDQTNPAFLTDLDRQMMRGQMVAGGYAPFGQSDTSGNLNREFWSNNSKLQALNGLRNGGVGNYARGPSFTPAGGGISSPGEAERDAALVQPGQSFEQVMAALRKAAGG
jgi:hypothetical protein